jgi:hypothetical protein
LSARPVDICPAPDAKTTAPKSMSLYLWLPNDWLELPTPLAANAINDAKNCDGDRGQYGNG